MATLTHLTLTIRKPLWLQAVFWLRMLSWNVQASVGWPIDAERVDRFAGWYGRHLVIEAA
mgnify:CR=1 FL=1